MSKLRQRALRHLSVEQPGLSPNRLEPGDRVAGEVMSRAIGHSLLNPVTAIEVAEGAGALLRGDIEAMTEAAVNILAGDLLALADAIDYAEAELSKPKETTRRPTV